MKGPRVTIPELRRMRELARIGLPCGSIGKLVSHEFGTQRTAADVRYYMGRYRHLAREEALR